MRTFGGIWPALVTPFTAEDEVDAPALRRLVEHLIGKQVDGFYVCGSTGQGLAMTVAERKQVLEVVVEQVRGRVPVIAHVGAVAVREAVALARHAETAGADGVSSVLLPQYSDARSTRAYYATLAGAVPSLPLLVYVFGGPLDAVALMRNLMEIPNVAGVKYTGPNMYELRHLIELRTEGWTVFAGMDEQSLFGAMQGSSGHIGSKMNLMPGAYREMRRCVLSGDLARGHELQMRVNHVTAVLIAAGFHGALKEALRILGLDCGQPRLPGLPFPADQASQLRARLATVGFQALAEL